MGDGGSFDVNGTIDRIVRCGEELRRRKANPERLIGKRTTSDDSFSSSIIVEIPKLHWPTIHALVSNHEPKVYPMLFFYLDVLELSLDQCESDMIQFLDFLVSIRITTDAFCPNFLVVRIFQVFLSVSMKQLVLCRLSDLLSMFISVPLHHDDFGKKISAMSLFLNGVVPTERFCAMMIGIGHKLCLHILSNERELSPHLIPVLQIIITRETLLSSSSMHAVSLLAMDDEFLFPFLIDRLRLTQELLRQGCQSLHSRYAILSAEDFSVLLHHVLHWDVSALVELLSSDCDALSYLLLLIKVLPFAEISDALHRDIPKRKDCATQDCGPLSERGVLVLEFDHVFDGEVTKSTVAGLHPEVSLIRRDHSDAGSVRDTKDEGLNEHGDINSFVDELKDLLARWGRRELLSFSPSALVHSLNQWQHNKPDEAARQGT